MTVQAITKAGTDFCSIFFEGLLKVNDLIAKHILLEIRREQDDRAGHN